MAPTNLRELIEPYRARRTLCPADHLLLKVPKTRLKSYRDRSFSKAAPILWNALPLTIRACDTFQSALKSYIFNADEKLGH